MKNKQIEFLSYIIACILLPCCAKYKVQHICQKKEIVYSFEERKDIIDIAITAFDQNQFKNYLSDYQPIRIHIKNKTNYRQELATKNISLELETLKNLKKKEPKLFFVNFIPCILTSVLGFLFWWEIVLPSVLILGACGCQLSLKQHDRAGKLLKENTSFTKDILIIAPYSSIDTIVFVKRAIYTPRFTVTLQTPETNTTTLFNVFITSRTVHSYDVK